MAKDSINTENYQQNLIRVSANFVEGTGKLNTSHPSSFDWLASRMHEINFAIYQAKENGYSDEQVLEVLQEVRQIQAQSPFVDRLQKWYRGYQGDFETIEYLMESKYQAEPNSLGFWIEKYCLNTAIAQQHRNKVGFQADRILQTIIDGCSE